jgi:hypothetical protein
MTSLTTVQLNSLSAIERNKINSNRNPLSMAFSAYQHTGVDKVTNLVTKKPISLTVKFETETNVGNDILRFSILVSNWIKADSGTKNSDGKYAKQLCEEFQPCKIWHFNKQWELSVEIFSNSLFPTDGELVNYPEIKSRCDIADIFLSAIDSGEFQFLKTATDDKNKTRIVTAYDDSVLLLIELLAVAELNSKPYEGTGNLEKYKFNPIPLATVLGCFISASNTAKRLIGVVSNGSEIAKLSGYAETKLQTVNSKKNEELLELLTKLNIPTDKADNYYKGMMRSLDRDTVVSYLQWLVNFIHPLQLTNLPDDWYRLGYDQQNKGKANLVKFDVEYSNIEATFKCNDKLFMFSLLSGATDDLVIELSDKLGITLK